MKSDSEVGRSMGAFCVIRRWKILMPRRGPALMSAAVALSACVVSGHRPHDVCDLAPVVSNDPEKIWGSVRACGPVEQVELYLDSIYMSYPPSYDVADEVAKDGIRLVDAILIRATRARMVQDDVTIQDLLILLEVMSDNNYYDVRGDSRLREEFSKAISRSRFPEVASWQRDIFQALWGVHEVPESRRGKANPRPSQGPLGQGP